jgi:hypothetical protein
MEEWGDNFSTPGDNCCPVWHMLRIFQVIDGDTIGAPTEDKKLCVPESRCTSFPNGEMVELASQVRVQKKKEKKSTHCRSGLGSINFLARKYG